MRLRRTLIEQTTESREQTAMMLRRVFEDPVDGKQQIGLGYTFSIGASVVCSLF